MFIQVHLVAVAQPTEPEPGMSILDDIYTNDEGLDDGIVIRTKLIDAMDSPLMPPEDAPPDSATEAEQEAWGTAWDKYNDETQAVLDELVDTPDIPYLQNLVLQLRTQLAVVSAKLEPIITKLETCDGFDDQVVELTQIQNSLRHV